jgi:hypothetical protein
MLTHQGNTTRLLRSYVAGVNLHVEYHANSEEPHCTQIDANALGEAAVTAGSGALLVTYRESLLISERVKTVAW